MVMFTIALGISMNFGLVKKCHAMPDILPNIMEEFKIYQPTILLNNVFEIKNVTQIIKNLSYQGYSIGFSQKQFNQHQSGITFTDDLNQFKWINPTYAPILVVSKIETKEDLREVDISIGSEVIFLDKNSLKVYESYTINKVQITRYLGQFKANNRCKATVAFVPSNDYIPSMEIRRHDFYGIQLTGAVLPKSDSFKKYSNDLVQFFAKNDTYDITKLANNPKHHDLFWGILELNILKTMENELNFTSKLFVRGDMKVGSPYISSNGSTVIGEGIFQNLVEGSIEFLCGPFDLLPIRLQFVDFLYTIWSFSDTIFLPFEDSSEEVDWNVFFAPFAFEVWIAILIKCIIFTAMVSIIEWFHDYKLVR